MILGIDAGNSRVKICGEEGMISFLSAIGESRSLNLHQTHGDDDMVFKYEGREGFAGSLALYESEFGGSIMGDTKAHSDGLLRVLLGIHRYCTTFKLNDKHLQIITGQPISTHTETEKDKIKSLITGTHTIEVNGVERTFHISQVNVGAEGISSYWANPQEGLSRIIDVGSATVNYASVLDGRYLDRDSGTLPFGNNTNKSTDLDSLTRGIATHVLKKWNPSDRVFIVGGLSESILPYIRKYLPTSSILYPVFNGEYYESIYANAVAFYNIGVSVYE